MQKLRAEPFLWIHIAGIVVFPLWMALTVIGLATGDPILPVWLEQLLVLAIGTGLVARMQIRRPFYLFSVLVVSLPPAQLSPQRCRILSSFQTRTYRLVPLLVILVMILLGEWLYDIAPLFHRLSFLPESRWIGLGVAILGFWGANLFIQIPAAAAWVLSSDQHQLDQYSPVDPESVEDQFTVVGKRWSNLLSRWEPETLTETPPAISEDQAEDTEDQQEDQAEEPDQALDQLEQTEEQTEAQLEEATPELQAAAPETADQRETETPPKPDPEGTEEQTSTATEPKPDPVSEAVAQPSVESSVESTEPTPAEDLPPETATPDPEVPSDIEPPTPPQSAAVRSEPPVVSPEIPSDIEPPTELPQQPPT